MLAFVKLSEIADLTVGFVGTMAQHYEETGVRFLRSLNIKPYFISTEDMRYISEDFCTKIKKSILHTDDLVIVRTGVPGTCCVIPEEFDGCNCSDVVIVRPNKKKVNPHYLAAYINVWGQKQIANNKVGAIQKHFNVTEASEMLIALPDMSVQNVIGDFVLNLNKKIECNGKLFNELEEMISQIYEHWFVQFDYPDEEGKPYKTNGGKMRRCEHLKIDIPQTWKTDIVEPMISMEKGYSYTSSELSNIKTEVPMISLASIGIDKTYRPKELKFLNERPNKGRFTKPGDLLIACTDLTRNCDIVGCPIIVPDAYAEYVYTMDLVKVQLDDERLEEMYFYASLRTDFYHKYIKNFASGTNVQHLDTDGILWYRLIIPPKDIQKKFSDLIYSYVQTQMRVLNENAELESFRDWVLPLLMNGQAQMK